MPLKENWIAFCTLFRRELVRIFRIWPETLVPPVITTGLYFVIFGGIIGSRIGEMQNIPYMQYIVPGLVLMTVINNSYTNVMFSFHLNKFLRNIEEMLAAPMSNVTILMGYVAGGLARGLLVGLMVTIVAMFFTKLSIFRWDITIIMALLTAFILACAGFINGAFAKNFDDLSIVPMFVLTPLTYFGGVFYSVDLLPPMWRTLSYFNPIFYMVSGFRYGMFGISEIAIEHVLLMLVVAAIALFGICMWLLSKGVGIKT